MSDLQSLLEWIGGASIQLIVAAALAWLSCVTVARESPALRHAIWVVVLLKCFVPPSVTAPWSLSQLWVSPAVGQAPPDAAASDLEQLSDRATVLRTVPGEVDRNATPDLSRSAAQHGSQSHGTSVNAIGNTVSPLREEPPDQTRWSNSIDDPVAPERQARPDLPTTTQRDITAAEAFRRWWMGALSTASLMFVWVGGAIVALVLAAFSIVRVSAKIRRGEQIDEGPAAVAVEEAALKLGLKSPPRLVATDETVTPFVAGLFRPTVVIPRSILESLAADELRLIVWHEVVHVARRDAWTSLLQLFSVAAFWFHPAVWWAASAVRREREACCDETVLRTTRAEPSTYGDAFLHVLSAVRGRAIAAPAWAAPAGVFERDSDLRSRIEQIMSFRQTSSKRFTVGLVAMLFALAVIPMGVRASDPWAGVEEADIPTIVSISPSVGATEVDPEIGEIKVTFDRPMDGGFSWTGSGSTYPPTPDGAKPSWSDDKTTCTLPVALKAGQFYRIGINSKSYQNFRSLDGIPIKPAVLTFTTRGANAAAIGRMEAPKIVAIDPPNGALDVHPLTTKEIRVTFDRPMGDGMSWVGGGESFPRRRIGEPEHWLPNSRTCVMPLDLDYGHEYRVSLNSDRFKNFQSTAGVPLETFEYSFTTVAKETAATLLSTSFEESFAGTDDSDGSYQDALLSTEDASDGKASLRLTKLDPQPRWPIDAVDGVDGYISINGTYYIHGKLLPLPESATSLEVTAMIRAEQVNSAIASLAFFELTPGARAGKENSYFSVTPPGADEDAPLETLFVGRSGENDPPADHQWALYRSRIAIPERAEFAQFALNLEDGQALWIDELEIKVWNDQSKPVGQASPDAAASEMGSLSDSGTGPPSTLDPHETTDAPSLQVGSDARADLSQPPRPSSVDALATNGDEGRLLHDSFGVSTGESGFEPTGWRQKNVQGVVLKHRSDLGSSETNDTASLELRKSVDAYFPIASWSRRLDHNDPTATHVQLTANIKAEDARKAVLDVLFLDEHGEWIRHQWADHIGDYRNEWLAGEGRLAEGTDKSPQPNGVTHDWQPYGGAVAIPPGTKFIEVSAQMYGPGTVFVDDVDVRYVAPGQ